MFAVGLSGVLYVGVMGCDGFGNGDMILAPFSHYWQASMDYDDSGATKVLNVAAVCPVVDLLPEVNRARMVSVIDRITLERSEVRLVLSGKLDFYAGINPLSLISFLPAGMGTAGSALGVVSGQAGEDYLLSYLYALNDIGGYGLPVVNYLEAPNSNFCLKFVTFRIFLLYIFIICI